jgi:glucokinase
VAISFAFPGPADYSSGIIGDLGNLPAFRGGVALGAMISDRFGVPTFINNDASLFTLGEAIAGLLPHVNQMLASAGRQRRYANLLGVTFGTGFGGGIVCDGRLVVGDTCGAGEIWILRHKLESRSNAEEGVSIRGVRRAYARRIGVSLDATPDPKDISRIALGEAPGDRAAACASFRDLGEIAGDALAQAVTLIDGLVVIGGGLWAAHALFLPALVEEMNSTFTTPEGGVVQRLEMKALNLEDEEGLRRFLEDTQRKIPVPGSPRKVIYDPMPRIGVGISRLGTSRAVSVGAYAFALSALAKDS